MNKRDTDQGGWVSGRTHDNGQAVRICQAANDGHDRFYADFGPRKSVVGHHTTEAAAQAEADQIMRAHGHDCSASCTPWTPRAIPDSDD
jgi:hypothetical protein